MRRGRPGKPAPVPTSITRLAPEISHAQQRRGVQKVQAGYLAGIGNRGQVHYLVLLQQQTAIFSQGLGPTHGGVSPAPPGLGKLPLSLVAASQARDQGGQAVGKPHNKEDDTRRGQHGHGGPWPRPTHPAADDIRLK